jgi:hypothetical protein
MVLSLKHRDNFTLPYISETIFLEIKHSKSKLRGRSLDENLQSDLEVSSCDAKVDIRV